MQRESDADIRVAAFSFLADLQTEYPDALPRKRLEEGFGFRGTRVPLVGPPGIFKPALMDLPLSITTVPIVEGKVRPYEDEWTDDGLIRYRYRGTDPEHRDNVGLRVAMAEQRPLVYFHGVVAGWYVAVYPVYVVGEEPATLSFSIAADEFVLDPGEPRTIEEAVPRRRYATRVVRQRLHQVGFRERVLNAYRRMCAICRLRHAELLDAAHILPDTDPRSEPVVPNGLSLCRLHHAAFDRNVLGVRPDLVVEIRRDVLNEIDGPMLVHGLQGFNESRLHVPRRTELRPNPKWLEERYEAFRSAS